MKSLFLAFSFMLFANVSAQEKKNFANAESLLFKINPSSKITSWMLVSTSNGETKTIYSTASIDAYEFQESGFQLLKSDHQFYNIVYKEGSYTKYVNDLQSLKSFVGTVNNPEEAALIAIMDGYFLDSEFQHLAGNYIDGNGNYILELAKITSNSCPLAKSHFEINIDKKSGTITSVKDNGIYNEVYDKTCKNNPHYSKLEKQVEEAAAKKEKEALENKEAKAKAKKKLMKSMNRR